MRLQSPATLAALIAQRGMTQAALAEAAGCSPTFVSKLCQGIKRSCTHALAGRIAEALSVPLDVLFMPDESATCVQNVKQQQVMTA